MEDDILADFTSSFNELSTDVNTNTNNAPALRDNTDDSPALRPARDVDESSSRREVAERNEDNQRDEDDNEPAGELEVKTPPAIRQPNEKPPVTWKGPLKESWTKLPAEVRQEITRREREIDTTLTRTAEERRYANAMFQAISPYEAYIRSQNANHVQAVSHLLQMSYVMNTGTPQAKAKLVAELIPQHGVDIALLDQYLSAAMDGKPVANDPVMAAMEQQLAPIKQFMSELQQGRQAQQQQVSQGAVETIQELLKDPDIGDMLEEVREDIADILDLASKRNQILPLRTAAVRAIMAHPEYSLIYNQRQLAKQAQQQTDKATRARRAGASLEDSGAPSASENNDSGDGSILDDLQSSVRQLSRRR